MADSAASKNLLDQDELDELLKDAGLEGSDKREGSVEKTTPSSKPLDDKIARVFQEDMAGLVECLFNKSCLKREKGVRIIWNASCVFPMNSGITLKLEGKEYISLGVLHKDHLIIGRKE